MEEYVVCPSNSPVPTGLEKNKTADFRIYLPHAIHGENLEVALVEANFPHNWSVTFIPQACAYTVLSNASEEGAPPIEWAACLERIGERRDYATIESLIEALNNIRPRDKDTDKLIWRGKFQLSKKTGLVEILLLEGDILHLQNEQLAEALGFGRQLVFKFNDGKKVYTGPNVVYRALAEEEEEEEDEDEEEEEENDNEGKEEEDKTEASKKHTDYDSEEEQRRIIELYNKHVWDNYRRYGSTHLRPIRRRKPRYVFKANKKAKLDYANFHLFIYTNIVKHSIVGNAYAQLLRELSIDETHRGQHLNYQFDKPRYLPVEQNFITELNFQIRHDNGELVKFAAGKSLLTLHFRPRQQKTI